METDAEIADVLSAVKTIAVVGIKAREGEDAYRIPLYMQQHGYRIIPVNPKLDRVLGEDCVAELGDIREPVDMVNVFRASENVPGHVEQILAMEPMPKAVWLQLGIHHGPSAARLRAAGIAVVQDRCIMVDHRRLLGTRVA